MSIRKLLELEINIATIALLTRDSNEFEKCRRLLCTIRNRLGLQHKYSKTEKRND